MKQNLVIAFYPIKPIYSNKIIGGEKIYELRKQLPKFKLDYVLIYSTMPVGKVVGYARVENLHKKSVAEIWNMVSKNAGISKKDYFAYFKNVNDACAIELIDVRRFVRPFSVKEISSNFKVPQSFCYINENDFLRFKKRKFICV